MLSKFFQTLGDLRLRLSFTGKWMYVYVWVWRKNQIKHKHLNNVSFLFCLKLKCQSIFCKKYESWILNRICLIFSLCLNPQKQQTYIKYKIYLLLKSLRKKLGLQLCIEPKNVKLRPLRLNISLNLTPIHKAINCIFRMR